MSKQHSQQVSALHHHAAEYRLIRHDLIKVVVLNAIYLAAILALYFSNKQSGFLEKWFAGIFHF